MANFKVKKLFRDIHTKELYEVGSIINVTVKRSQEIEKSLGETFIERVDVEDKKK